ncbi:hypothetical protein TUM4438_43080 [Shewanella sairae]|uniref:Uncharacterized protein n=2 Tax=Shewanella sairae TaxID=190310 RepID=A0ABQ4PR37_9GAMM|nr:hypothetical protein TUM4438_43080 [Shewanella sairae]
MDFNGSSPGLGHYAPWSLLPSSEPPVDEMKGEEYIKKLMYPEQLTNYYTVYSSDDFLDTLNKCKAFAEENMDHVVRAASMDMTDHTGQKYVISYRTLEGEFFPMSYPSPIDGYYQNVF